MKEAIVEIMRFLFENGYDNIICGYDEVNKKSKRMQEKTNIIIKYNSKKVTDL